MENKAIQIEPKAATEMQSWTNIYDRVPSQYRQAENWMHNSTTQRDIQLRYCTTILLNQFAIHQNIQDYTSNYVTKITGQSQYFEVLQLDRGILRVRPLYNNQTNMMRTCTVAVTAMGKTAYIYLSQDANPF